MICMPRPRELVEVDDLEARAEAMGASATESAKKSCQATAPGSDARKAATASGAAPPAGSSGKPLPATEELVREAVQGDGAADAGVDVSRPRFAGVVRVAPCMGTAARVPSTGCEFIG